ncbi:MAG: hypothetical protein VYE22_17725 [Myxococcota bacterium]|nr:hypothetical protein [Myxococcota bacterium]
MPEPAITLVFDTDCPHVDAARASLARVLTDLGLPRRWDERAPAGAYGSPTLLVDGRDVTGDAPGAACCRVYRDADGRASPVPDDAVIAAAIRGAMRVVTRGS